MSPHTKRYLLSRSAEARFSRLPAYVSLSKTVTAARCSVNHCNTKLEPIKPAPPVTNSVGFNGILSASLSKTLGIVNNYTRFRRIASDE
jgi:hypothetical protein